MRRILPALLFAALLQTPQVMAQSSQTGVLSGIVRDAAGGALAGATVTVASETLASGPRTASSDSAGHYRFPGSPPGAYHVTVMLAEFKPLEANARLHLGQLVTLDMVLQPGSAADRQVSADEGVASEMSAVASTHITSDFLSRLHRRTVRTGRAPPRSGSQSAERQCIRQPGRLVQCVQTGDLDSSIPTASAWVLPALNSIEEVRVVGPGAGAEHGGFTGAASDTLLRSGTNVFHGLAEALYRNGSLTATDVPADVVAANPDLSPTQTDIVSDNSVPLAVLSYVTPCSFAGAHHYARLTPGGYPAEVRPGGASRRTAGTPSPSESSPRVILRPTWKCPIGAPSQDSCMRSAHSRRVEVRHRASRPKRRSRSTRERSPGTDTSRGCSHHRPSSTPLTRDSTGHKTSSPDNGVTPGWYRHRRGLLLGQLLLLVTRRRPRPATGTGHCKQAHRRARPFTRWRVQRRLCPDDIRLSRWTVDRCRFRRAFVRLPVGWGEQVGRHPHIRRVHTGFVASPIERNHQRRCKVRAEQRNEYRRERHRLLDQFDRAAHRTGLGPARRRKDGSPRPLRLVLRRGAFGRLRRRRSRHRAALWCERRSSAQLHRSGVSSRPGTNHTLAPTLQAPRTREAVAGFEHRLFKSLDLDVYAIDRRSDRTSTTCCKLVRVVS